MGAAAPRLSVAMIGRLLMAIGGALMTPASLAILRTHVAPSHRGKVFGIYSATVGLAAAIGPPLGGELVYLFGWRAIFLVNVPLLVLAAALHQSVKVGVGHDTAHRSHLVHQVGRICGPRLLACQYVEDRPVRLTG